MNATTLVRQADYFLVVGTSLQVYPAAGLLQYVPSGAPKFLIDPQAEPRYYVNNLTILKEKATDGMKKIRELLAGLSTEGAPLHG